MPAAKPKSKSSKVRSAPRRPNYLPRKADIVREFADLPPLRADGTRLIGKKEVMAQVNLSYPTIIDRMRRGEFPAAVDLADRPMWREAEVFAWIASLPRRQYSSKEYYTPRE